MFNWDADYDDLVKDRAVLIAATADLQPEAAGAAPSLRERAASLVSHLQGFAGKWAMAGAVALMLGALGTTAAFVPRAGGDVSLASFTDWSLGILGLAEPMPEGLLAYEQPQFDNFRRGIARFSDAELIDYLRAAQRDLDAGSPTADFTRDALFLAHREVERRGLPATR